jgi:hypothetical protein
VETNEKELIEMFKAGGYVHGEISEIAEDGLELKDLKSIKDIIENKEMLLNGFKVEGDFREVLKSALSYEQAINIIAAYKTGFDLGKK